MGTILPVNILNLSLALVNPSFLHSPDLKSVDNSVSDTATATTLCLALAANSLDEFFVVIDVAIE